MLDAHALATDGGKLENGVIEQTLRHGLRGKFSNRRVLALIPDHTRSLPLPCLFRQLVDILHDCAQLDFMVALGTHPPLTEERLLALVGISREERATCFRRIGIFNHAWNDPATLMTIGEIDKARVRKYMGESWHESLDRYVPVTINRRIEDYDHLLILSPVFPHEVVGFSGGAKYLFPGISGAEIINITHWMGALAGVMNTIGIKDTPPRRMLHEAVQMVSTPVTLVSMVVEGEDLAGIFIGDIKHAWEKAVDLSSRRHIRWTDKPFHTVLSHAPSMYDELWTAGKAVYKLEEAVADGGEIIIYSPTLREVSLAHAGHINRIGYHLRDYFLAQWDKFRDIPLGAIAHSTHVRGAGAYVAGVSTPRITVTLATALARQTVCDLALSYRHPDEIDIADYRNREDEGILYVPKAGEILYKVKDSG